MGWLGSLISGVFGLGSTVVNAISGGKSAKAEVISRSLSIMGDVNASDADKSRAAALIISQESKAGGLAALWRPITMLTFLTLIVSSWFGYIPPALPPGTIDRTFDLMELGISGYIGARSLEKIVTQINISGLINKFISKLT